MHFSFHQTYILEATQPVQEYFNRSVSRQILRGTAEVSVMV